MIERIEGMGPQKKTLKNKRAAWKWIKCVKWLNLIVKAYKLTIDIQKDTNNGEEEDRGTIPIPNWRQQQKNHKNCVASILYPECDWIQMYWSAVWPLHKHKITKPYGEKDEWNEKRASEQRTTPKETSYTRKARGTERSNYNNRRTTNNWSSSMYSVFLFERILSKSISDFIQSKWLSWLTYYTIFA